MRWSTVRSVVAPQSSQRGEAARGRLVGGRQVVQMKQVCCVRTGTREHLDPGGDEPLVGGIVDGGEDAIGRTRTILEGGRERNQRRQRICTLERGRVIERMDVPFHELAQQNRGVVCAMNLSLLEGLLAGLDTNDFSPSLEIEPGRFCVVLCPRAQEQPPL
jgi:hypothetical protein